MKHKISKIGIASGIVISISSIIRWFFIWYDPSQLIIGISVGAIVCYFAYIYDWMKNTDIEINRLNQRMDKVIEWWTKHEI